MVVGRRREGDWFIVDRRSNQRMVIEIEMRAGCSIFEVLAWRPLSGYCDFTAAL